MKENFFKFSVAILKEDCLKPSILDILDKTTSDMSKSDTIDNVET